MKDANKNSIDRYKDEEELRTIDTSIATFDSINSAYAYFSLAITPDARKAISGSEDNSLKIWDLEKHCLISSLEGHSEPIHGVAISSDGRQAISGSSDNTLKVWDLEEHCLISSLEGYSNPIHGVAVSGDGRRAISGSVDGSLNYWNLEEQRLVAAIEGHTGPIVGVDICSDGRRAVSGSEDKTVKLWNLEEQRLIATLEGHGETVNCVAMSIDGRRAISGSDDTTLKIWDLGKQQLIATLEGHNARILDVVMICDGQRAVSASGDATLKIWDLEKLCLITTLEGHSSEVYGVAIGGNGRRLVSASDDGTLKTWDLSTLETAASSSPTERYTNAKVVLVGESGVGKSGLALRLSENNWRETGSTHGMTVTKLDLPSELPVAEREAWLWDFAGQPDYRLIHQLYMDETALALMVIDPQNDEPFAPLGHWEQALSRAVKHDPEKLLVAARCDRGGYVIGQRDIDAYLKGRGYAGHVNTSAKLPDDPGCAKLKDLIAEHIPWDRLPSTSTTKLFKALKDAVIEIKESGIVLIRFVEIKQRLENIWDGEPFEERNLRTVIGLLASQGLIQPLDFGDFVLLQPEQINNYGSAVVRAARECESELAELPEKDVLEGEIDFKDMMRLSPADEKILLRSMLQIFLERGLCYRVETTDGARLVFPAYFKQDRPEIPKQPDVIVTYAFSGPVDQIYTTLIVRLHYTNDFEIERLWRYAGDFNPLGDGDAGLMLTKDKDDAATIKVYFDSKASIDNKVSFIKYIHEHLKREASDVIRIRDYVCPHCSMALKDKEAIAKRQELGFSDILCGVCEERVPLQDLIEEKFASDEFSKNVRRMERESQIRLDNESLELILIGHAFSTVGEAGHIFRTTPNCDWGIDGEIEFKNDKGEASGRRLYVKFQLGKGYWTHERSEGVDILRIENAHHAAQWQASEHPVMLVIRDVYEKIQWMNVTEYFKRRGTKRKQIDFKGEPFTAINVHKQWRKITSGGA